MRLLADRAAGCVSVRLLWDETAASGSDVVIEYEDTGEGIAYMFRPPSDQALDAFYHPNAYRPLDESEAEAA